MVALMLMLFKAFRVSRCEPQAKAALTLISPKSLPLAEVVILISVLVRAFCSVVAPMLLPVNAPLPEAIVKLVGSINQVPVLPLAAFVVTIVLSATLTVAALVSIAPPLPPLGALASKVPATLTVPASIPPNKVMTPA